MKGLFETLHENGDGKIGLEGIRKLIRFLGRPETDAEIEAALYDLDPSGEIDYAQFKGWLCAGPNPSEEPEVPEEEEEPEEVPEDEPEEEEEEPPPEEPEVPEEEPPVVPEEPPEEPEVPETPPEEPEVPEKPEEPEPEPEVPKP
ncbi:hypothetical protein T484DRAFT_3506079 [Baffinella frigidus]|nr:hypothetical protein T484DRAFT_3506079 [Cryptophyta sp. CCMP2293]